MDKLGERLAASESISAEDYALLEEVADAYQAALDQVEARLRQLGFQATTRVKTTGTLVDKLRREHGLKLKAIHDLAGARIVIDGGRLEQDRAAGSGGRGKPEGPRRPAFKGAQHCGQRAASWPG